MDLGHPTTTLDDAETMAMRLVLPLAVLGAGAAEPAPPGRTVMAWVSTSIDRWEQCASFLSSGGEAEGTVSAISTDNLYHFDPALGYDGMLTTDAAAIAAHKRLWQQNFRTYPMIGLGGTGNISTLRPLLFNQTWQNTFITFLVNEAVARDFDGINIDFEPGTDVVQPDNNPTARDALALAELLSALGTRLHAANKTLSLDAMAVTGACWTKGEGHEGHPNLDLLPCPWIRRFCKSSATTPLVFLAFVAGAFLRGCVTTGDLSALSAVDTLDRIISMDTYTDNSTEFSVDMMQYHFFFPVKRFGLGLCPLGCGHAQPTSACLESRIGHAVAYGATEIDLWSLWDSSASNWTGVSRL